MLRTQDLQDFKDFNSKVDFMILDTALIPLHFTNNHVNKRSNISA